LVGKGGRGVVSSPTKPIKIKYIMNNENFEDDFEIESEMEKTKPKLLKKEMRAISMKRAVAIVVGLHLVAVFGIVFFSNQPKSFAEDKKLLENLPQVGVETSVVPTPSPTPTPEATPKPKVIIAIPEKTSDNYPRFSKEYTVKKGDTFHGIVNKYRLNPAKLKKLNNIKDENKIYVGQKLKLM
jgi:cytoskeletal protein RodZ